MDWIKDIGDTLYTVLIEKDRYLSFLTGLQNTIIISLFAVLLGIAIGFVVAMVNYSVARNKKLKPLGWICDLYINLIRGTPVFLQLLIIYNLVFTSRDTNPLISAIVCFGLNSGAYVAEIIRAGLESIDKGQMEAGNSLGLNNRQVMLSIILPQAIKNVLPALANEFIVLIKETAIAGAIAIPDITKAAQNIGGATYKILPPLYVAAAIYLIIVLGLTKLLRSFERKLAKSDRR